METSQTSLGYKFFDPVLDPKYNAHLVELNHMGAQVCGFQGGVTINGFTGQVLGRLIQVREEGRNICGEDIQHLRRTFPGTYYVQRSYGGLTDEHTSLESALRAFYEQVKSVEHQDISFVRKVFRDIIGQLFRRSLSRHTAHSSRRHEVLLHLQDMLDLLKLEADISRPSKYTAA